jgi:hypothetical protein
MRKASVSLLLAACCCGLISGCGSGQDEPARFQANLEEAIKAAEKGKELVKSPHAKSASRRRL